LHDFRIKRTNLCELPTYSYSITTGQETYSITEKVFFNDTLGEKALRHIFIEEI
jgi:hypothetical protein